MELDYMYACLKTINFDGFQFGKGENFNPFMTIIDSKKWLDATYETAKNFKREQVRLFHENQIRIVFENFKSCFE